MVDGSGEPPAHLIEDLFQNADCYEFFQAVRILEEATREQGSQRKLKCLGSAAAPQQDPIHFRSAATRIFPPTEITKIRVPVRDTAAESEIVSQVLPVPVSIEVAFMGLFGPHGALPGHYTSLVIERSHPRIRDYAFREFLDLFNHRAITMYYLAWRKHRISEEYQRCLTDGHKDTDDFTNALYSLVGLGLDHLRRRFSFNEELVLFYGGLFARPVRTASGLEQILSDFLRQTVSVCEFQGRWITIPAEVQSAMPSGAQPSGQNLQLGMDAVAGSQAWDEQSMFRIIVGPLNCSDFQQLLPQTNLLNAVEQLVRFYAGQHLDFEIQLILQAAEVPQCRLGADSETPARLGWTTWLGESRNPQDSADSVFRFSGLPA